ncbi:MAG: hypothetical protein ACOC41_05790 [Chitinivibrionales bacterium]
MLYALIGIIFFLILILIAVRLSISEEKLPEEADQNVMHASGIYSIVRRSPREQVNRLKKPSEQIRQYLSDQNVKENTDVFSEQEIDSLVRGWDEMIERNIVEVEEGDKRGVEFYFYEIPKSDTICRECIGKGFFVTREQIFKNPQIVPPFHIGCQCRFKAYYGTEDLHETTEIGIQSFIPDGKLPPLPHWESILKPT